MNFLVNKILDDGSVSYGLTGSGYVVLIIVCVLLMTIGCFARDNNSKLNVKHIAFAAMAMALAVATSMIKVIKLPMGGSVTLFSMLFIVLIGYWYGIKTGLTAAIAYGVLQLLLDPYILNVPQVLLDYILGFGALGFVAPETGQRQTRRNAHRTFGRQTALPDFFGSRCQRQQVIVVVRSLIPLDRLPPGATNKKAPAKL
jgi:thiamine transporter